MSTDERYDEAMIADAVHGLGRALSSLGRIDINYEPHRERMAVGVLAALANAGLLLPPGGETTEQIEVQTAGLKYPCGDMAAAWRQLGELRGKDWVKDAWIVTRTVHYGPWRPVPPWTEVPQ